MELKNNQVFMLEGKNNVQQFIQAITQSGTQDDPFFVLDVRNLVSKYQQMLEKLPRVKPHYAVKCNDSTLVLKILSSLGCSFDCASKGEIRKVTDLGVDGSRIVFANPTKIPSHIRYANNTGVQLMTFDNENELHKIKNLYPTAKLLLRIRCDARVVKLVLGDKYGCDMNTEAPDLMHLAAELGLNIVGICFHVGSGCEEPPSYARGIAAARDLFDLGKEIGFNMNILDIGGGFPGDKDTSIDEIATVINTALDKYFPKREGVFIMSEPGRYFVSSAFTLTALIVSKRKVKEGDSGDTEKTMYYLNDGIFGSFNGIFHDNLIPAAIPLIESHSKDLIPSTIWGPTCDSTDLVQKGMLPDFNIGEWLLFENMGAYTRSLASTFNGYPIPNVYAVVDKATTLLLKNLNLTNGHSITN